MDILKRLRWPLNIFLLLVVCFMVIIAFNPDKEGWWIMSEGLLLLFVIFPCMLASLIISSKVAATRTRVLIELIIIALYFALLIFL